MLFGFSIERQNKPTAASHFNVIMSIESSRVRAYIYKNGDSKHSFFHPPVLHRLSFGRQKGIFPKSRNQDKNSKKSLRVQKKVRTFATEIGK